MVLPFDECQSSHAARKIGVEFDKPVSGGLNLHGLCHEGRGFFVETSQLVLEDEFTQDESSNMFVFAKSCLLTFQ